MAVYNNEKFIKQSIDSILKQTFSNFELIIINDGSTDNTTNILKEYYIKDNRIKIINNKSNIGLTKSLNIGLAQASGKYIARLDADDISLPERIMKQYTYLEKNSDIFLCATRSIYINTEGNTLGEDELTTDVQNQLKEKNCLTHSSIMFRNTGFKYRDKFYFSQDYDLYLNLLSKGLEISVINEFLVKRIVDSNAISYKRKSKQKLFSKIANKFYRQRKNEGYDHYDSFDENLILSGDDINDNQYKIIEDKIILLLKSGQIENAKKLLADKKTLLINKSLFRFGLIKLFLTTPLVYKLYSKIRYRTR